MKLNMIFAVFTVVALIFSAAGIYFPESDTAALPTVAKNDLPTVVIDAGHGGEDGGACIYGDIPEKELNLSISKTLCDMLTFCGIDTVMTRTDDRLLYDINSDYQGHKKSQDLANRLKIAQKTPNGLLISIHMNAFPESKYSGLQVYYSPSGKSDALALLVQNKSKEQLLPNNNRKIKKADKNIYLLDRFEGTGILVECGFMSNPEEYKKLSTYSYRQELSGVLLSALLEYIENGGR